MDYDPLRRGFAEFIGTFTLVFIGAGSILTVGKIFAPAINSPQTQDIYGGLTLVGVALAHGLAIAVMVSAVGHISGGHFNPAVTVAFFFTRRIAPTLAVVYLSMQFAAATAAAALLKWLYDDRPEELTRLGAPVLGAGVSHWEGLVIEIVLTFFLVFTVFGATDVKAPVGFAGLPIGLVLTLIHLVGIPVTNTSVNHARHPDGRPVDRRRDEPGTRVRPGAPREGVGRRLGLVRRALRRRCARRGCVRLALSAAAAPAAGRPTRERRHRAASRRDVGFVVRWYNEGCAEAARGRP